MSLILNEYFLDPITFSWIFWYIIKIRIQGVHADEIKIICYFQPQNISEPSSDLQYAYHHCQAAGISFYNYNAYKKDIINNVTSSSMNQISALSDRLEIAYNEMVNLVVNCAERKSLFLFGTSPEMLLNDSYTLSSSAVLRDFCAISGYSDYIYKISMYSKDQFLLQAGTSYGSSDDVEQVDECILVL